MAIFNEGDGWKDAATRKATKKQNQAAAAEREEIRKSADAASRETLAAKKLRRRYNEAGDNDNVDGLIEQAQAHEEKAKQYKKAEKKHFKAFKKALSSTDLFLDKAPEYLDYVPAGLPFSIGDYCGRVDVDRESMQFIVDVPDYVKTADLVPETGTATAYTVDGAIMSITTDPDDRKIIFDLLTLPESTYNDDTVTAENVLSNVHYKRITNRENLDALSLLAAGRDPESVTAENLLSAINSNLCPGAKKAAEIWTNSDGFAALDVNVNGAPMIKKTPDGDFIYNDKYIVREFPAEILPNLDEGAPLFVGGLKDVIRFGMLSDETAIKENVFPANIEHREIVEEIPVVTTQSKAAYIYCRIA